MGRKAGGPGRTDKLNAKARLKTQPHENQTKPDIREQEKNCRFRDTDNGGTVPFFSGGKWRFAERIPWWDAYTDATPVVVGHYWRRVHKIDRAAVGKGDPDLFENTHPFAWHGQRGNVFCVDFSVGGRWVERKAATPLGRDFKLAALRWPERVLQFDDGSMQTTENFGGM
ncbi:hypothetical protein [Comamonas aquatica]|uniref:hypothetical protein n=1 Tax=Comamonas aquatica TaxID=225991 RepID=UPI001FD34D63|nr:hypothetical protein [Comamonas aquatica]